ncbi:MAG: nucleotidyltransferase domain-containing protein [Lentisphaerae bacterium]|nr:nucleotidyltransferase domain-containing protein [Lentisphaerota bacterium]
MFSLDAYHDAIIALCRQLRVHRLDVVGSATRADFRLESDVDVLVTFDGADQLFDRYFTLKEGLEALFSRPVDVIMEEAVQNPLVRQSLQQERRRVYAA